MPVLFEIRNLICSYNGKREQAVLEVPKLDIELGEVVFLLGASGSGKSTLLELLGLMNNTRVSGSVHLHGDKEVHNYEQLWRSGNSEKLSAVRRSALGFIFQNTNLMNNFSVYENICLSSMIQRDLGQAEAMTAARDTLQRVGMSPEQIELGTKASRLSGGQRQRVAFARALNSAPKVLFGDEPAGNLDEKNADDLMQVIRSDLRERASAIIVSHDIRLAMRHADRIICLHKPDSARAATIRDTDVFTRSSWAHLSTLDKESFALKLRGYYQINTETLKQDPLDSLDSGGSSGREMAKNYWQLFLRNEGRSLMGPAFSNLIRLVGILLITLLAVGFANGSLEYLNKKLKNPFVNWLTIDIPYSRIEDSESVLESLKNSGIRENFHISSVTRFKETSMHFLPCDRVRLTGPLAGAFQDGIREAARPAFARTIATDEGGDPLLKDIFDESNLVSRPARSFKPYDMSLVVTASFLDSLGYPRSTPVVYYGHDMNILPLTVRVVVEEMPGRSQILMTEHLMKAIRQPRNAGGPFDLSTKSRCMVLTNSGIEGARTFAKVARDFIVQPDFTWGAFEPEVLEPERCGEVQGQTPLAYTTTLRFNNLPNGLPAQTFDTLFAQLCAFASKNGIDSLYRLHDYSDVRVSASGEELKYDRISINFSDLERVRSFAEWTYQTHNQIQNHQEGNLFQADLSRVREKENFYFLSAVAYIISFLVLLFGILSITMFVANMLISHLSRITMNIGTFKAFGLGDNTAFKIYFVLVLQFLLIGVIVAFFMAFGFGNLINFALKESMFAQENIQFFRLFDWRTELAIGVVLLFGILAAWQTIRRMLNKSPGDLIYNR
jgi:lipoprotein-releasing system ATP-binding protein